MYNMPMLNVRFLIMFRAMLLFDVISLENLFSNKRIEESS